MAYRLIRPVTFDPTFIEAALRAEGVECVPIESATEACVPGYPTVLVLDPPSRSIFQREHLEGFIGRCGAVVALGRAGEDDVAESLPDEMITAYVPHPYRSRQLLLALRSAFRVSAAALERDKLRRETAASLQDLNELTRIGVALSTERDYNTLLDLILSQARRVASSDAGSLYLVETPEPGQPKRLRFKLTQNESRPDIPFVELSIPIDHASIAGYVASTGEPLVIDDAYHLPAGVEYSINRRFDEQYGYRTRSLMTIPMRNHRDEVIGVLQLINRKRHFERTLDTPAHVDSEVIPYSARMVEIVSALAGQAAVSIENSQLYEDIERLFEGFVRAAVTAIEQRDPTTFGHSGRVARMTVDLAKVVDRADAAGFRGISFSRNQLREIQYAGLLHDFGKVGVREQVLVKAKKLYAPDLALVKHRHGIIRRTMEREFYRKRTEFLERRGLEGYAEFVERLGAEHDKELRQLERFLRLVLESNEPTVLPEGNFQELLAYRERFYEDLEGNEQPYLSDDELRFLTIRKGSLDEAERLEIESHVNHTYRFLMQIPWTEELQGIPTIAYGHHEKLDGTGYPRGATGEEIPLQTRMMTISDIFDALTASDRPYKRAVPAERALAIMHQEVKAGMLDSGLFELFTTAKVFDAEEEGAGVRG